MSADPQVGENVCRGCAGSGEVEGRPCGECGGSGTVEETVGDA